jgi:diacylglycerol O-acyltransferase
MDRMTFLDASFLYSETENDLHHNAWLGIFEGPPPTGDEFQRHIASKLPAIPRYRQRVRFVPQDLAAPVWVDDVHFHLPHHVRHIALPAPGTEQQLRDLFTTLMAQPLDRNKPLWEMWMVEGLEDGRWALISKLHHCMADGATTTDITTLLLDREPVAALTPPDDWHPEPSPTDAELVQAAMQEAESNRIDQAGRYFSLLGSLREQMAEVDKAFTSLGESLSKPLSVESLNGPIGPHRRWAWAKADLSEVNQVRQALGGTVNDVVLALVARAFRDLLVSRGEDVEGRTVRSMVPVSVRIAGEQDGNRVSSMYAELPVGVADPVERLAAIRAQMDGLKASKQALAGDVLASLTGFQPPALLAMGARAATHASSPVNTVTTNVPGPQFPLYVLGRKMLDDYPYITLASTVRLATTVFSYDGVLRFGVTGDYESTPDIETFARGLSSGLDELVAASSAKAAASKPRRKQEQGTKPKRPTKSAGTATRRPAAKKTAKPTTPKESGS